MTLALKQAPAQDAEAHSGIIHRSWDISVRNIDQEKRSVDVVASTDSVDSWGEVLVQDWDLERYEKNPVVLYNHNRSSYGCAPKDTLPIGHAENVRVEKNKLLATLFFVNEKANELAEKVWQGFIQKSIRAVSVGFRSKQAVSRQIGDEMVFVLSGNKLIEISVVPIGANEDAVVEREKSIEAIRSLMSGGRKGNDGQGGAAPAALALPQPPVTSGTKNGESPMSTMFKTILALLALNDTATEAEAVDKVKSLERSAAAGDAAVKHAKELETKFFVATETDSVEKALGAIAAGKSAVAKLGEVTVENEKLERASLIKQAKDDKKLSPHQEKELEGKSLDFVKAFIALQQPNPLLTSEKKEQPPASPSVPRFNGKAWSELKPREKHDLYVSDKPLYDAMKNAAERDEAAE